MQVNVKLDEGSYMPTKAHDWDAGFDLRTPDSTMVPGSVALKSNVGMHPAVTGNVIIDTGVHMEIPKGYVGFIKSKSGLNIKASLVTDGVVDAGYTGSIVVKLYNQEDKDYLFDAGDKIAQIVLLPIPEVELVQVDELGETERGDNGFGSSGR